MAGFVLAVGVLGLVVGSFANVVALRVPEHERLTGRSRCPRCGHVLAALDLVPVASWLVLRGRCRHCATPVGWAYPAGELTCGVLFAALAVRFEATAPLVAYLLATAGLVALSIVDLRTMLLPNRILGPVTIVGVTAFAVAATVDDEWSAMVRAVAAGGAAFAGLGVLHLAYPRGLGFGDVKLAFLLGVLMGWVSWGTLALGLFAAVVLGAVVGVAVSLLSGGPVRGRQIPFGPFLAAGAVFAVLVGEPVLDWYARLNS
jgi:leader peptidase (prepilin peptidase)/N-methyltransferase